MWMMMREFESMLGQRQQWHVPPGESPEDYACRMTYYTKMSWRVVEL
jgi:hypothetical protein